MDPGSNTEALESRSILFFRTPYLSQQRYLRCPEWLQQPQLPGVHTEVDQGQTVQATSYQEGHRSLVDELSCPRRKAGSLPGKGLAKSSQAALVVFKPLPERLIIKRVGRQEVLHETVFSGRGC